MHFGELILGSAVGRSMTTVNELLPSMLIIVSVFCFWRFLGRSMRSNSREYWRSIRSRFRDENQSRTRIGTVLAGWLDADNEETFGYALWNTRIPERDAGACGPIAAHRLRADGGFDSSRSEGDAKKQILLACCFVIKSIQRVNAQELTEQADTQEIFAEVCRLPRKGELVVFNPLTGEQRALPALLNPRTPVLVHLTSSQTSFKVIVAGRSTASHFSREVEVFDSVPSEWKGKGDLPGSAFSLNEHQGGVCVDDIPICILFLKSGGRHVVALEVETEEWVTCAIPDSCSCITLQLVESGEKVYLFSAPERGEHCIDEHEFLTATTWRWKNVIRVKTSDARSLPVDPEQTCLGFRDGKLCILNALNRDGVVHDIRSGELLVKISGHGDSRAADSAKQVLSKVLRLLSIPRKISLAFGVFCILLQQANAQQLIGSSDPADPAAWLTSDTAKGAFFTALIAGGLGAVFIWKRFFCRPPTFTVASINAGLEASPPRVRRDDLDSTYPLIDEC